jgi:fibrillarin-like rRNA methylase
MPSKLRKAAAKLLRTVTGDDLVEKPKKRSTKKTASKKVTKKAVKKTAKKTVKKTVQKTAKKSGRAKTTEKPTKKTVRKSPAKKTVKKNVKKTAKKTAKKVNKTTKKTAKKSGRAKAAKKTAKKAARKAPAKKTVKKTAAKKTAENKKTKTPAKAAKKAPVKVFKTKTISMPLSQKPPARKKKEVKMVVDWSKAALEPLTAEDPRQQPWEADRSKIRAAITGGLPESYLRCHRLLYIGAAHGYTISHIHEYPVQLYAVEKSPEMMRHFLPWAEDMPSVLPILGDAAYPDAYAHLMPEKVDVLFQDIAQKDQVGIFLANCDLFLSRQGVGILSLKAGSVNSTAEPAAVFADTRARLEEGGATIVQEIPLEEYHKGHRLYVVHLNPYFDF